MIINQVKRIKTNKISNNNNYQTITITSTNNQTINSLNT